MWIKICGIRDAETAAQVAALRPDAVGLNFYAPSPRCIPPETARDITACLPPAVQPVGVFVNHSRSEIVDIVSTAGLTMIQLHGDESPEFLAELQSQLPAVPLIRAWRMGADLDDLALYLMECQRLQIRLAGCLIEAKVTGAYGGSGRQPPWEVLQAAYRRETWPPVILAGGLTPDNVAPGISAVQPWGVDVASGVESAPGVKELDRVAKFILHARSA